MNKVIASGVSGPHSPDVRVALDGSDGDLYELRDHNMRWRILIQLENIFTQMVSIT